MKIEKELFKRISQLAGLNFNEKEEEQMLDYLKSTLSHFEQISQIDTKKTPILTSPLQPSFRLRKDKAVDFSNKDGLLDQAPEKQGRLFKVPPVV